MKGVRWRVRWLEDWECSHGPDRKALGSCCDREHRVVRRRSAGYCGQPPPVTGAGRGELEGTVRVSEIPAKATESEDPSDHARAEAAGELPPGDAMWQISP